MVEPVEPLGGDVPLMPTRAAAHAAQPLEVDCPVDHRPSITPATDDALARICCTLSPRTHVRQMHRCAGRAPGRVRWSLPPEGVCRMFGSGPDVFESPVPARGAARAPAAQPR